MKINYSIKRIPSPGMKCKLISHIGDINDPQNPWSKMNYKEEYTIVKTRIRDNGPIYSLYFRENGPGYPSGNFKIY